MKSEYYLYLDESEDEERSLLAIAGIIIKADNIKYLEEEVYQIKKGIWEENYVKRYHPILHSNEFNYVEKNAGNADRSRYCRGPYHNLSKRDTAVIHQIYRNTYESLASLIQRQSITTVACMIQKDKLKQRLHRSEAYSERYLYTDYFDLAMEHLTETFCHFLIQANAVGHIVYEARSSGQLSENSMDVKMQDTFCQIKSAGKGICYLSDQAVKRHIRNLNIVPKSYDSSGLQIADFVAFNCIKMCRLKDRRSYTRFMKQIYRYSYNGGYSLFLEDERKHYGYQMIP